MPAFKKVIGSWFIVHGKKQTEFTNNYELITPNQKGFTLIELMVVIAIIAILAAVGIVTYASAQKAGRVSKRAQDLKALQTALELFKTATGAYPVNAGYACIGTTLDVLVPDYMPALPADPLDNGDATTGTNCYQYVSDALVGNEYKVRTHDNIGASASGPEMDSANFAQQRNLIDPARDGGASPDCDVDPNGTYTGWSVYNGSVICSQ